jgi:hypothetical protein
MDRVIEQNRFGYSFVSRFVQAGITFPSFQRQPDDVRIERETAAIGRHRSWAIRPFREEN